MSVRGSQTYKCHRMWYCLFMTEVDSKAFATYRQALKDHRNDIESILDPQALWADVKPEFYADARILSEDALAVFESLPDTHPPYGLASYKGEPITSSFMDSRHGPWHGLNTALRSTGWYVMQEARPTLSSCAYHEALQELGGVYPTLRPYDFNERGLDTLRDVVTPGAMLNASLFTSLIYRLPVIQRLHGNSTDTEAFARNSVSLLREPLAHPQQRAAAFVLSLGSIREFHSPQFLNDDLALRYTKIETINDTDRLAWAIPTEEFTLRQDWGVQSRVLGSERDLDRSVSVEYPAGTRLSEITIDEPTIGCPGNKLASAMWQRAIGVVVAESLGDY